MRQEPSHRRPSRTGLMTLGILFTCIFSATADETTQQKEPASLVLDAHGEDTPLCDSLFSAATRQLRSQAPQCSVPIEGDDPNLRELEWKRIDLMHDDLAIRKLFAWSLIASNLTPESKELLSTVKQDGNVTQLLANELWERYSYNLGDLVGAGEYQVERSTIASLNPAGPPAVVYRSTMLKPNRWPGPTAWLPNQCGDGADNAEYWTTFVDTDAGDWPTFMKFNQTAGVHREVIQWSGRPYFVQLDIPRGLSVSEPQFDSQGQLVKMEPVCSIAPNWE